MWCVWVDVCWSKYVCESYERVTIALGRYTQKYDRSYEEKWGKYGWIDICWLVCTSFRLFYSIRRLDGWYYWWPFVGFASIMPADEPECLSENMIRVFIYNQIWRKLIVQCRCRINQLTRRRLMRQRIAWNSGMKGFSGANDHHVHTSCVTLFHPFIQSLIDKYGMQN